MSDIISLILQVAQEYSECPSGKKGGDLGWFPRGKMAGPFQEVAFNTPVGVTSAPFKSTYCSCTLQIIIYAFLISYFYLYISLLSLARFFN
jgi:NIMA-interacting peptidyl-prolyl cis-trans isomerase 4